MGPTKTPLGFKMVFLKRVLSIIKPSNEYKKKENFKKVLAKITLNDVISAIDRAEEIRKTHEKLGEIITYGKFNYCKENPDLTVHECIREILEDCGIITKKKDT